MIIYQEVKKNFLADIEERNIQDKISDFYYQKLGKRPAPAEKNSWKNSLQEMYYVLNNHSVPEDAKITIEYNLPTSNYRIDFIISGINEDGNATAILIELKQWEKANLVEDKDAIVTTFLGGNPYRETTHPSYQIWSYLQYIKDYSEFYHRNNYDFQACAYLHNYKKKFNEPLLDEHYSFYTEKAHLFFHDDRKDLSKFISKQIQGPDIYGVINSLDQEPKKPTLSLQKDISDLIAKNKEFTLLDSQKVVFEEIKRLYRLTKRDRQKRVVIVEGGPGTGKSVLAFQLLAVFLKMNLNAAYVSKNSAVRQVFAEKLTKNNNNRLTRTRVNNLMLGSGQFLNTKDNFFDCLLVDEAHRLNLKSGMFQNKGENQIQEIISASRLSIFFVDDYQVVTSSDIGQKSSIVEVAKKMVSNPEHLKTLLLESQFRLNGSNNFLTWLDNALNLQTSEEPIILMDYDFQIIDSIDEFYEKIKNLNTNNNARMLAGYCWNWTSKKNKDLTDINLSPNFRKQWNLETDPTWAINEKSFEQIGCVHTAQGLEFDYTGIIIGNDLAIENGKLITLPLNRAKTDKSLKGLVSLIRKNDSEALQKAHNIILNTYRVLLTRATRGCYVYFTDPEVKKYFQDKLDKKRPK